MPDSLNAHMRDVLEKQAIRAEVSGVNSDGLIIARLPAAKIPANGVNVS